MNGNIQYCIARIIGTKKEEKNISRKKSMNRYFDLTGFISKSANFSKRTIGAKHRKWFITCGGNLLNTK